MTTFISLLFPVILVLLDGNRIIIDYAASQNES